MLKESVNLDEKDEVTILAAMALASFVGGKPNFTKKYRFMSNGTTNVSEVICQNGLKLSYLLPAAHVITAKHTSPARHIALAYPGFPSICYSNPFPREESCSRSPKIWEQFVPVSLTHESQVRQFPRLSSCAKCRLEGVRE
jgi:hypothetical protein